MVYIYELSEEEDKAVERIALEIDLTPEQVIRQAIRLFELHVFKVPDDAPVGCPTLE
jgi:hypothetical protein